MGASSKIEFGRKTRCIEVAALSAGLLSGLMLAGCGGASTPAPAAPPVTPPTVYSLTVNSTNPATGVSITVNSGSTTSTDTTAFSSSYAAGTQVTIAAPATVGTNVFRAWTGCTTVDAMTCDVTVSANTTVTVGYTPGMTVTVTPGTATVVVGNALQLAATVAGETNTSVTWSVSSPAGSTLSPGTISSSGLYQTPYPAPASVTVTATSSADTSLTGSATLTLSAPATATGPALTVDTSAVTHPISPLVYGMNFASSQQPYVHVPVDRWGGDGTSRYNYLLDVGNIAADYYFETLPNTNTAYPDVSQSNTQFAQDRQYGTATLATVPLIGYTTIRARDCGFSVAKYGAQQKVDQYWTDCGNGVLANGQNIVGNDPADTSTPIDETFVSGWVNYLVNKFGTAANGGIGMYELDNEPEFWDGTHRDVHPAHMSYDEVTNKGLSYAQAVKTADPTALVSGPVISYWPDYYYSRVDLYSGWSSGPNYVYNGNPVDRQAHGNVPLLAYYLQQFQQAEITGGTRLLDYLDLHAYFAPPNVAFEPAGDTALQASRLNSTRVFWDPTYTDPAYTDPNVIVNAPPLAPQIVPLMRNLVTANYPGTKLAITEYNWGGLESVNGALAQAEIMAIFGREGLDMGTLWGPPDPVMQVPGLMSFEIFESYDGAGSHFGDGSLAATSAEQNKLAIYAAQRSADNMLTVLVLNKSFGSLTSSVKLTTSATSAQVYQYSSANPNAIAHPADLTVTGPVAGTSTVTATFPAQSMTLFVMSR